MLSMKNLFSVTMIIFVLFTITSAQEVKLNYGVSVGYSSSLPNYHQGMSSGWIMDQTDTHNHYNVMVILEFYNDSNFRFQTGLKFYEISYSYDIHRDPNIMYIEDPPNLNGANFSYLAIPIDVNYHLPFISNFYLSAGFETVLLLSGNTYYEKSDGEIYETPTTNGYRSPFFMYMFGVGYEYQLEIATLFIEAKYSHHIGETVDHLYNSSSIIIEQISINFGVKI